MQAHDYTVEDGVMDPEKRHKVFIRLDFKVVGVDFVLPPVSAEEPPCTDLILFTYVGKGHKLPTSPETGRLVFPTNILTTFLEDFACASGYSLDSLQSYDWHQHMLKDMKGKEFVEIEDFPWRRKCTFEPTSPRLPLEEIEQKRSRL